jgi:hypothetical protein
LIVLCVILLILLLILMIPVGVDACWDSEQRYVRLRIGPIGKTILPGGGKKPKKEKPKPQAQPAPAGEEPRRKRKLTLDELKEIAEIALNMLRRICYHLRVDRLMLHYTAASDDPYGAVLQYGRVNALLGSLAGPLHRVLRVVHEDVRTDLDFEAAHPRIAVRIVVTIQIWEILLIALSDGIAALKWYSRQKREASAESDSAGKETA